MAPVLAAADAVAQAYDTIRATGESGRSGDHWRAFTDLMGQPEQLSQAALLATPTRARSIA